MTSCGGLPGRARRAPLGNASSSCWRQLSSCLEPPCVPGRAPQRPPRDRMRRMFEKGWLDIRYPEHLRDMLFSIRIASLAPLSGALLLVGRRSHPPHPDSPQGIVNSGCCARKRFLKPCRTCIAFADSRSIKTDNARMGSSVPSRSCAMGDLSYDGGLHSYACRRTRGNAGRAVSACCGIVELAVLQGE